MIINRPAIDWLTLTTYDLKSKMGLINIVRPVIGKRETRDSTVMQYAGKHGEGFFIGDGQQKGKDHHMFRFSGDLADWVTWQQAKPSFDCSRIDLQLTLPLLHDMAEVFDLYVDLMRSAKRHESEKGQKERNIDGVLSPDGFCTLYVGSRESGRFYRLYIKESGGDHFIRFEVEYKGKNELAGRVWRDTTKEPTAIVNRLAGELSTLPDHPLITPFTGHLRGVPAEIMKLERRRADPEKTLKWLRRQVSPAMKRLLGNHDTRDAALILLHDWKEFSEGFSNE